MNSAQVFQEVSIACFNSAQRSEGHFVDITEMVLHDRLTGQAERM